MNFGPVGVCNPDTSCVCMNCGDICGVEQMHEDEFEYCQACGCQRAAEIAADRLNDDDGTGGEARYCGGMR